MYLLSYDFLGVQVIESWSISHMPPRWTRTRYVPKCSQDPPFIPFFTRSTKGLSTYSRVILYHPVYI